MLKLNTTNEIERTKNLSISYQENVSKKIVSNIRLESFLEMHRQPNNYINVIREVNARFEDRSPEDIKNYLDSIGFSRFVKWDNIKESKEITKALKLYLPVGVVSGIFTERNDLKCISHSGIYLFDYDNVISNPLQNDELLNLKEALKKDSIILSVFLSPSGLGLKVLIKSEVLKSEGEVLKDNHVENYLKIAQFLKQKYSYTLDLSCQNISRASFISYDSDLYINYESEVFEVPNISIVKPETPTKSIKTETSKKNSSKTKRKVLISEIEEIKSYSPFHVSLKQSLEKKIPETLRTINEYNSELLVFTLKETIKELSKYIQYEHGKNMRTSFFTFVVSMMDILNEDEVREYTSLFGCRDSSYIDDAIKNCKRIRSNYIYIFYLAVKNGINLNSMIKHVVDICKIENIVYEKIVSFEMSKYYVTIQPMV